ncbi:MAG: twin-arginine translocation signal domain-containing protein, partial [Anaerolineae bacterium]|nr:twin-arginine translocation signal domain-containing protein [Anaerolineae bacterium]
MCNHHVMKIVRDRVRSQPPVSRRNFLRAAGLTSAGLAVASSGLLKPRLAFA